MLIFERAVYKLLISILQCYTNTKVSPSAHLQALHQTQINFAAGIGSLCLQVFISRLNKNTEKAQNTNRNEFAQQ